jgi:hypothetical protein
MAELFRYAAFISYSSKDAAFARRLHRALEGYRIPLSIGEFDLIGGGRKNRIYPVFLDREEFSAGALAERVEASLRASAALIVVCSPNAASSPWVQREIEIFSNLGRKGRMFLIIAESVPLVGEYGRDSIAMSLPPQFQGDALIDGDASEPLAADAREGKDGFRRAFLKIVAGLIEHPLGAVLDRDRQRRLANTIASVCAVIVGLAAVIVGSVQVIQEHGLRSQAQIEQRRSDALSQFAQARSMFLADRIGEGLSATTTIDARSVDHDVVEALDRIQTFWSDAVMTRAEVEAYLTIGRLWPYGETILLRTQQGFLRVEQFHAPDGGAVGYARITRDRMIVEGSVATYFVDLRTGDSRTVSTGNRGDPQIYGPSVDGAVALETVHQQALDAPIDFESVQVRTWSGSLVPENPVPYLPQHLFLTDRCDAVIAVRSDDVPPTDPLSSDQDLREPRRATLDALGSPVLRALQSPQTQVTSVETNNGGHVRRYIFTLGASRIEVTVIGMTDAPLSDSTAPLSLGSATAAQNFVSRISDLARRRAAEQENPGARACGWQYFRTGVSNITAPILRPDAWATVHGGTLPGDGDQSTIRHFRIYDHSGVALDGSAVLTRATDSSTTLRLCVQQATRRNPACIDRPGHQLSAILPRSGLAVLSPRDDFDGDVERVELLSLSSLRPLPLPTNVAHFNAEYPQLLITERPQSDELLILDMTGRRIVVLRPDGHGALRVVREISGLPDGVSAIFAATPRLTIAFAENEVAAVDTDTGRIVWVMNMEAMLANSLELDVPIVAASPDGHLVAFTRGDSGALSIRIIDVATGTPLTPWEPIDVDAGLAYTMAIGNDGRVELLASRGEVVREAPRRKPPERWNSDCTLGVRVEHGRSVLINPFVGGDAARCGYGTLISALQAAASAGSSRYQIH